MGFFSDGPEIAATLEEEASLETRGPFYDRGVGNYYSLWAI